MRKFATLDALMQDISFGTRLLRRSPTFTLVAVLSLAAGIGSTAAVFDIADAVLLRTLTVASPHRLREFRAFVGLGPSIKQLTSVPEDALSTIRNGARFGQVFGFRTVDDAVLSGDGAEQQALRIEFVSDNYFEALGIVPAAGRTLTRDDARTAPVPAVLSERLWRTVFASDAHIAGRPVTLNGTPSIVVGVARSFRGLLAERPADVMVPEWAGALIDPPTTRAGLRIMVRLHPGISPSAAEAQMASLYKHSAPNPMLRNADIRVTLRDAGRGVSGARETLERPLSLGLALVGVLLLVACANTGGLLLVRFASRSGEFGIRLAIGAGRGRLMRQVIVEALLLAVLSAIAGLLAARIAAPLLLRLIPVASVPPDFELRFDWRLALFTGAVATVAALVATAAPLFRLMRSNTSAILTANTRSIVRGRRRLTELLIAAQVACSLLLLVAAGAMARTLINLAHVDPGFDATGVVALTIDAGGRTRDEKSLREYYARLHERLAAAPQVLRVSSAQSGLMTNAATTGTVDIAGWSPRTDDDRWVRLFWVGPDFFDVLHMPMIAGSGIGSREASSRGRVAVVNRAFAEFYFGSVENALGRMVNGDVQIVGITADARYGTLRDEPVRAMFVPYTQAPSRDRRTFLVRIAGDTPGGIASALAAIHAEDPRVKVNVATLRDQIASTLSRERFVAILAIVLSALGLFLSCAGVYASVAYSVSARRPELALRLALGATGRDIVGLVLADPMRVTAIGLVLGVPGAYVMLRGVAALLFGVKPFDVVTVAVCGAGLLMIAAAAAVVPARRAAAIEPMECLKVM
jgi:predicted permease